MAALAVSACSSSDESSSPTTSSDESSSPSTTSAGTDAGTTEPDAPTTPGSGGGEMTIETDTGESWTLEQFRCSYTPDNEGAFVQLWTAGGTLPNGDFVVQEATSPDPSKTETIVDGTLVDDDKGILYVVIEGEASSDGTTMTMTLGMHDSPLKVVGDPIDLTATVTCTL
ncbi:MAG: hypothetical protein ACSLFP_02140 [Acidimicrobiales bacterium]